MDQIGTRTGTWCYGTRCNEHEHDSAYSEVPRVGNEEAAKRRPKLSSQTHLAHADVTGGCHRNYNCVWMIRDLRSERVVCGGGVGGHSQFYYSTTTTVTPVTIPWRGNEK